MRITAVSVEYARTVRVREFESVRASVELSASLGDDEGTGEPLHAAMAAIWQMARANVREQVLRVTKPGEAHAAHLGLPDTAPTDARGVESGAIRVLTEQGWTATEVPVEGAAIEA